MDLTKDEITQYSRHLLLKGVGMKGQQKLIKSKVLVIGAGGLGCPILQYLTAAGVGTIGIIDDDLVDISNLQRQILYTHDDIGKPKVTAAKNKLARLNPHINIIAHQVLLTTKNALELFNQYDIIVDGSDNFQTRYLSNDAAVIANKPLVFGSIYKFEGQVSVFNYENGPTYRCLFPSPPQPNEVPNCSEVGVLGILPGIVGSMQANEVLKIILELGNVLSGKLLTYNTLNNAQYILEFVKSQNFQVPTILDNYDLFCGITEQNDELRYEDIRNHLDDYFLIDVREPWEHGNKNIGGINIPVHEMLNSIDSIPLDKPILLYCEIGSRSEIGKQLLKNLIKNAKIYTLKNGIQSI
ncbi:MAG: HesA/MoeB/ThiF family protein [Putridiphycobacter sp.]|nr:HesA/MoeB/ThiF family protein [Putridiphycobacter sp.]